MEKTYKIKGMHCNSCSTLIEKELKDVAKTIKVSYSNELMDIDFDENKTSEKELKERLKRLGYELEEADIESKETPWMLMILGGLILLFLFIFIASGFQLKIPQINITEFSQNTSLVLIFIAGLITGLHCVAMCGGFIISYTSKNAIEGYKGFSQHLVYGTSKLVSYTVIGAIFGLIGGVIAISIKLRAYVAIFAGIFMIFYSLSMFGIKFFRKFQIKATFLSKLASKTMLSSKGQYKRPMITGLLNGLFIACGPLQAMYIYAAGTGSWLNGAISLAVFGLGTLPIMLFFASFVTTISHKTTNKILRFSAVIVLILGLIMLNRGLSLTGNGLDFSSVNSPQVQLNNNLNNIAIQKGSYQEINMDVTRKGYSPDTFILKKGVPVKWNINGKELTGCNSEIVVNDYNLDINLKPGLNAVEFTPDKTGTIKWSCGMGMIQGVFIVSDNPETMTQEQTSQKITGAAVQNQGSSCGMGAGCGCGM